MFSLPKLLVLAGIVLAVLYGYRLLSRIGPRREAVRRKESPERKKPRVEAQDLVKCPSCGTYIAPGSEHDCAD